MAFFDNRKKKSSEILGSVHAPEIPESVPGWFSAGAVDMPSLSIFRDSLIEANSWINVEVAAVYVGSRIPPQCDKCDDATVCNSCGKKADNYLKVMSANADGDYLVWTMAKDQRSQDMRLSDGIFTVFDASVYPTFNTDRGFTFQSQKMVPVHVGTISVSDTGDGSARLFIADAFAAVDSNDFITGVDVHPGDYQVIAFIGYTSTGDLAPMAVGAFGAHFAESVSEILASAPASTEVIREIVSGSGNASVLARFGNNQDHYAEVNRDLPANQGDISWFLQLRFEADPDEAFAVAEKDFGIDDYMWVAYAMNMRGKKSFSLKLLDMVQKRFGSELSDYEKGDVEVLRALEPGFIPQFFHCSRLAVALQAEAGRYAQAGENELALEKYFDSALLGNPNSLGSYTWSLLLEGKCQESVDGFEKAKSKAIDRYRDGSTKVSAFHAQTIFSEIANAESNYALSRLGVGANLGEAIAIWEPNLETGHTETRFFLAMAQHKVGEFEGRDVTLAGMSEQQWSDMKDEMKDMSRNAKGFFQTWCAEGAEFLKEFKK